jgi:hypothetical protein
LFFARDRQALGLEFFVSVWAASGLFYETKPGNDTQFQTTGRVFRWEKETKNRVLLGASGLGHEMR